MRPLPLAASTMTNACGVGTAPCCARCRPVRAGCVQNDFEPAASARDMDRPGRRGRCIAASCGVRRLRLPQQPAGATRARTGWLRVQRCARPRSAMAPSASASSSARPRREFLPPNSPTARSPGRRRRTAMCCPRALPLPAQPVRDDRIRARLPRVARARGDRFHGLLVERQGVRGGCARDRRGRLRRRDRRRRGFARAIHAVRLSFAGVAVPRPCRPCAIDRDGISIGEAAGFALLDPDAGADVHLLGAGESSDAHHMSSPHPEGAGAARAMRAALADAHLRTEPESTTSTCTARRAGPTTPPKIAPCFPCSGRPRRSVRPRDGPATRWARGNHGRAGRRTCAEAAMDPGNAELRARRPGARLAPSCCFGAAQLAACAVQCLRLRRHQLQPRAGSRP